MLEDFRRAIRGEVRADPLSRQIYSVDASIFQMEPTLVVIPRDREDLCMAVELAQRHALPVIPRGAATGISGGCIGPGLVLDLAQHLNQICDIDWKNERVRVEPGVVQNTLNAALVQRGYRLGPDTSTGNRATIGGMLANNASGSKALYYGDMAGCVEEVSLLLASGETLQLCALDEEGWAKKCRQRDREGEIYRTLSRIATESGEAVMAREWGAPKKSSGYLLGRWLADGGVNPATLIAGSEGTLGIATEIVLKIAPLPPPSWMVLIPHGTLERAFEGVDALLEAVSPISFELIDFHILETGRQLPLHKRAAEMIKGTPQAVWIVEVDSHACAQQLLREFGPQTTLLESPEDKTALMKMREAGLGLLMSRRSYQRAVAFLEDFSVAPARLKDLMGDFFALLRRHGKEAGVYGHIGSGCLHIRPYVDLRQPEEIARVEQMMRETVDLLLKHRGELSGEHGDGWVRSWLNRKLFGEQIYQLFCEVKAAFDPQERMNPGKVVALEGWQMAGHLRAVAPERERSLETIFSFAREGGMALAADLCNGNALCRKREGAMCPTFQATGDEYFSTRARAQVLRSYFSDRIDRDEWLGEEAHQVLEHCIECKACKSECPSQVDMAKLKAEYLYHYQEHNGYSLQSRLIGNLDRLLEIASWAPRFANRLTDSWMGKKLLRAFGVAEEKNLPKLAENRFSKGVSSNGGRNGRVILFNDTYTEHFLPQIGEAFLQLMQRLDVAVEIPKRLCCGRTRVSMGDLQEAKARAREVVELYRTRSGGEVPVIVLEPSCLSMFREEYVDLAGERAVEIPAMGFEEWLLRSGQVEQLSHRRGEGGNKIERKQEQRVALFSHCHDRATAKGRYVEPEALKRAVKALYSGEVKEIGGGGCGMAGAFGYLARHRELSEKIGALHLYPALRDFSDEGGGVVIANGFSCRNQIRCWLERHPAIQNVTVQHFAQWAAEC